MGKPAQSIDCRGIFVQEGLRRVESERGLMVLGVEPSQQHYLELPDAGLTNHEDQLEQAVAGLAQQIKPDAIVSFDTTGFDYHADHRATHTASLAVAGTLAVDFFARLSQLSQDGFILFGDSALKRKAILQHTSQYDPDLAALTRYIGHPAMERYSLVTALQKSQVGGTALQYA